MKRFLSIIIKALVIIVLVLTIVLIAVIKKNPEAAEAMTRGFSRGYIQVTSFISGLIPFVSLTELVVIAIAIVSIILIVLVIRDLVKIHPLKAISKFLTIPIMVLTVIVMYSLSCQMAYNRKEMPLPYYESEVDRTEFVDIYNFFADDANLCASKLEFTEEGDVKGYDLNEATKLVKESYKIVTDSYFSNYFGAVKPMMSSFIYREFQITGVSFNALGEANINVLNTKVNLPFTIAHELAHTKGVMREDDANKLSDLFTNLYDLDDEKEYTFKAEHDGHYFITFTGTLPEEVTACIDEGENISFSDIKKHNRLIDLGYIRKDETMVLTSDDEMTGFVSYMDIDKLVEGYDILSPTGLDITYISDTEVKGTYKTDSSGRYMFSIPYEKGWTVFVDGKKQETIPAMGAFLSFNTEAGEHEVVLKYTPYGLAPGVIISLVSVGIVATWMIINKKRSKGGK